MRRLLLWLAAAVVVLVIDLDFDTTGAAGFLSFLQAKVWASSVNSPALIGTPQTMILELADPIP